MDQKNSSLSSLIAGVIVGAALTYLFATRGGAKIRDQLIKDGKMLLAKVNEEVEKAASEVEEKKEEVGEKLEAGAEAVSEIPEHIAQIQKKGRRFFFRKPQNES